ncbi:midnolin-like [Liolophura sinensis]|uniref:midnolin-like n=1 Tax=Liolophura sinensis TaxID=3198878 RepID=UPI0031580F70
MSEGSARHPVRNSNTASQDTNQSARKMKISICPTTGGRMELNILEKETVNGLKWLISRNLRIPPEKITLLYKNRLLDSGQLQCYQVTDGSRITLLPNMESGLSVQKSEVGVIQALENLSDSQVNDFLSGKAPLLLAMRLGDHMMFVQLQLSTAPCVARRNRNHAAPLLTPPTAAASPSPTVGQGVPSTTVVNSTVTGTSSQGPPLSPNSLTRASRNLSQKLQQLSRITSVNPKCSNEVTPFPTAEKDSGATIESMHHHGKGVYSGTFSGTLDPTLQDRDGKPKRDISTIIHILNDLLGANPALRPSAACPKDPTHHQPNLKLSRPPFNHQGNLCPDVETKSFSDEEEALRGKLHRLQQMMEERRMRRRARRDLKSPYQWHGLCRDNHPADITTQSGALPMGTCVKPSPVETMKPVGMDVGETVGESSYNNTAPMEHETLAV